MVAVINDARICHQLGEQFAQHALSLEEIAGDPLILHHELDNYRLQHLCSESLVGRHHEFEAIGTTLGGSLHNLKFDDEVVQVASRHLPQCHSSLRGKCVMQITAESLQRLSDGIEGDLRHRSCLR